MPKPDQDINAYMQVWYRDHEADGNKYLKGQEIISYSYCKHWHFKCNTKDQNTFPSQCYSVDYMNWTSKSQTGFERLYHHCKNLQRHERWTALKIILSSGHMSQCFHHISDWDVTELCIPQVWLSNQYFLPNSFSCKQFLYLLLKRSMFAFLDMTHSF